MTDIVDQLQDYEPPQITTFTEEVLLEELGPAQTVYGGAPSGAY